MCLQEINLGSDPLLTLIPGFYDVIRIIWAWSFAMTFFLIMSQKPGASDHGLGQREPV